MHVFLDSEPLGHASNPNNTPDALGIRQWMVRLTERGDTIYLPEIIDYELRRELVRANKPRSIALLDLLKSTLVYIPLETSTMLRAATLWANARNAGIPTADARRLDIDVILAAQVQEFASQNGIAESDCLVATSNVNHLSRFIVARTWGNIP